MGALMDTSITMQLPNKREEDWRWSDVAGYVKADALGLQTSASPEFILPEGVSLYRQDLPPKDSRLGAMAAQYGGDAYVINVPEGMTPAKPLILKDFSPGHSRIKVILGSGAQLSVIENYDSAQSGFSNIEISYELSASARLSRLVNQFDEGDATKIVTAYINAWKDAELSQHILGFGGGLVRLETRIALLAGQARLNMKSAYLLGEARHLDLTSYVDCNGPSTQMRQSARGVVTDHATGVFQGKIHVRRPAQHTDAEMRHDALILSDTAQVQAKPALEIYADDVACAHGNTIGALDANTLFYMRQRGLPEAQARAILTEAFVAKEFGDLPDGLRDDAMLRIRSWLEAH